MFPIVFAASDSTPGMTDRMLSIDFACRGQSRLDDIRHQLSQRFVYLLGSAFQLHFTPGIALLYTDSVLQGYG